MKSSTKKNDSPVLHDMQNEADNRQLAIDRVGVKNLC